MISFFLQNLHRCPPTPAIRRMHRRLQEYDPETASITNLGQSTFVDFVPGEDEEGKSDPKVQPGANLWEYKNNLKRYLARFVRLLVHDQVTIIFVVSVGLSVCLFVRAVFLSHR